MLTAAFAAGEPVTVTVAAGPFVNQVHVTCEIKAIRATAVTSPRDLPNVSSFTIATMIDEGTRVAEGDVVIRFDESEVRQHRLEKSTELISIRSEKASKELDAQFRQSELRTALAQAEARVAKAEIDASIDPAVIAGSTLQDARHELEAAHVDLDGKRRALVAATRESDADQAILRIREESAAAAFAEAELALELFARKAPRAGIVVFAEDWSNDRKLAVGDVTSSGQTILTIQDVSEMMAECDIDQSDRHLLALGARARVLLDAHPAVPLDGKVAMIAAVAESPSRRWFDQSDVRVFKVAIELADPAAEHLKPGLTARADLTSDDRTGLVVPRAALAFADGSFWARVQRDGRTERVAVVVSSRNATHALIASGLAAGDIVTVAP